VLAGADALLIIQPKRPGTAENTFRGPRRILLAGAKDFFLRKSIMLGLIHENSLDRRSAAELHQARAIEPHYSNGQLQFLDSSHGTSSISG